MPKFKSMNESDSGFEFALIIEFYGRFTFLNCTSLRSLSLDITTRLVNFMFTGCISLIEVSFPQVTTLPAYCFMNCTGLKSLDLPVSKFDGDGHFSGCTNLGKLSLIFLREVSENATKIFENCKSLKYLMLSMSSPITFNENIFSTTTIDNISLCLDYYSKSNYKYDCKGTNCSENYWKGINIELTDHLKRKCNVQNDNIGLILPIIFCTILGIIIIVFILLFCLYRKTKKEKDFLHKEK